MNIILYFFFTLPLLLSNINAQQPCSRIFRRPEIKELTPDQLRRFIRAVQLMNRTESGNFYTESVGDHLYNTEEAHSVPAFFPWHRVFLKRFEDALQRIDPTVVLPYWDWSRDSQSPEESIIFREDYFGGNGRSGDRCVANGPFRMFQVMIPKRHCLSRRFNGGSYIKSFYPPESIESIINDADYYDRLRRGIEGAPHATVHSGIGGRGGDFSTMQSPNDPIFYLHHAFIDLIWHEWQQRNPHLANTYEANGVSPDDNLVPFNVPVKSTFDTRGPGFCYYYSRYSANSETVLAANEAINESFDEWGQSKQSQQTSSRSFKITDSIFDNKDDLDGSTQVHQTPDPRFLFKVRNPIKDILKTKEKIDKFLEAKLHIKAIIRKDLGKIRASINSLDRKIKGKLRQPEPVPEDFLVMNGIDIAEVRKQENKLSLLFGILNSYPKFKPVADIN